MFQDDAKEEEDMSVDSDEEPHSYPITAPLSQPKTAKPPPTKLRVSFSLCYYGIAQFCRGSDC